MTKLVSFSPQSLVFFLHVPAAVPPVLAVVAALPLDGDQGLLLGGRGPGLGPGERQQGDRDAVTPAGRVHAGLGEDQEVLGRLLELDLRVQLGEGIVGHALPPGLLGPQVGDDGDGLLNVLIVIHGVGRGRLKSVCSSDLMTVFYHLRYDMFRTEATPGGTDRPHTECLLVQGDGDAQRGQERHLPEVIRREDRARAVGPGV